MRAFLDPDNLPVGERVDCYRVVRRLGGGGQGTAYQVEKDGEFFALKMARHREQSHRDEQHTDGRIQRELACLLAMRHRHIARVWAHGRWPHTREGYFYLVMDYVEGCTLGEWQERHHPTAHELVVVLEKVLEAVAYMHALGILHRDLKPGNILVDSQGEPVVVDYGAAHFPVAPELTDQRLPPGTPRYTSPEATRFDAEHRHHRDARYEFKVADELYALGVTLYDLLTDPRPWSHPQPLPVGSPYYPATLAHEENARVPVALGSFAARLMALDPAQRPVSAEAARRGCAEFVPLTDEEWTKRPFHPPASQAEAEPVVPLSAAAMPPPSGPPPPGKRRARAVAAALVLSVLVAGGILLSLRAAVPVPALPQPPSRQEEVTPVKPATSSNNSDPSQCSQTQAPPPATPQWRAWCQCAGVVGTVVALQAGCTGPQIRPASAPCSEEALRAMKELDMELETTKPRIIYDISKKDDGEGGIYVSEGPVTGVVTEANGRLIKGTLIFGEIKAGAKGGFGTELISLRYTQAQLPDGSRWPICIEGVEQTYGEPPKPEGYLVIREQRVFSVRKWAYAWGKL